MSSPRDTGYGSGAMNACGVVGRTEEFGEWTSEWPAELPDDACDVFDKRCARDTKSRENFRNGFLQLWMWQYKWPHFTRNVYQQLQCNNMCRDYKIHEKSAKQVTKGAICDKPQTNWLKRKNRNFLTNTTIDAQMNRLDDRQLLWVSDSDYHYITLQHFMIIKRTHWNHDLLPREKARFRASSGNADAEGDGLFEWCIISLCGNVAL